MKFEVLSNELLSHLNSVSKELVSKAIEPLHDNFFSVVRKDKFTIELGEKNQGVYVAPITTKGLPGLDVEILTEEDAQGPTLKEIIEEVCKQIIEDYKRITGIAPAAPEEERSKRGRKPESEIGGLISDNSFIDLFFDYFKGEFGRKLCVTPNLPKCIVTFSEAYAEWCDAACLMINKVTYLYRLLSQKFTNMAGCGLRNLQKAFAWFTSPKGIKEYDEDQWAWEDRAKQKLEEWKALKDQIKNYLTDNEVTILATNPH